jgi:hypothetical protein
MKSTRPALARARVFIGQFWGVEDGEYEAMLRGDTAADSVGF